MSPKNFFKNSFSSSFGKFGKFGSTFFLLLLPFFLTVLILTILALLSSTSFVKSGKFELFAETVPDRIK